MTRNYFDTCESRVERAKIYKCEDSRSKKSRQDEKEKSRGCSHGLGQSDGEVEWLSEMVGVIEGMGKPGQDS